MNTKVRYLSVLVADLTFKSIRKRCLERSLKGVNFLVMDVPLADGLVVLLWGQVIQVSGYRGNYLEVQAVCWRRDHQYCILKRNDAVARIVAIFHCSHVYLIPFD